MKAPAPAIYSHTGLRGIAAMYVVIFHLVGGETGFVARNAFLEFFRFGGYAVDLFFILSGFILNYVYISNAIQIRWSSYLRARIARILPLYYLTFFLSLALCIYSLVRYGDAYLSKDFPVDCLLNMFLVSGIVGGWKHTINMQAWSISVEFFCYVAVFPLLSFLKKFLTSSPYATLASFVMASICTCSLVTCYNLAPIPIWHWGWDSTWLSRGIWGFSTGFFLCAIYSRTSHWKPSIFLINFVVLASIAIFLLVSLNFMPGYFLLYAMPFVVFFSAADQGFAAKLLSTEPFQWLGERSYSIYLWHTLCMDYTRFLRTHLSESEYEAVVIVLILGISEISYRFIECPLREYIRKRPLLHFRADVR